MNAIYSPAVNTGTSPTVAADHLDRANKISMLAMRYCRF